MYLLAVLNGPGGFKGYMKLEEKVVGSIKEVKRMEVGTALTKTHYIHV